MWNWRTRGAGTPRRSRPISRSLRKRRRLGRSVGAYAAKPGFRPTGIDLHNRSTAVQTKDRARRLLIAELIDTFLAYCSRNRTPATVAFYRARLNRFRQEFKVHEL